jgi:hypothetical protein
MARMIEYYQDGTEEQAWHDKMPWIRYGEC